MRLELDLRPIGINRYQSKIIRVIDNKQTCSSRASAAVITVTQCYGRLRFLQGVMRLCDYQVGAEQKPLDRSIENFRDLLTLMISLNVLQIIRIG
jgi:hypothetical protein